MFSVRRLLATFKAFCDKEMSVTGIKSGQLDSFETCSGGRNVFTMLAFEKKGADKQDDVDKLGFGGSAVLKPR